ncbi:TetR/AcrR family transcriptional regulator [Paeniglutamicibacter antarcticus]|uniref:TetR/AcrR family transcriptional regulator n=1 Tax=Arthrobacter terrae TaxID=2935737 RepID=A0A931CPG4_9MICC|nr:TetR/AcrR family transcriptional regulator [Arthrobacter terrae]MBG0740130.1 TetR/AcrR family transcriptional regulator [Arthrobacter terrae]
MMQPVGRPRKAGLEAALILAAEELVLEHGFSAVSVEAVAARAGTSRPAFYRRFSGVPALIFALLAQRFEITLDVDFDFGNLRLDLEAIQHEQAGLFGDPLIARSLAGFLDCLHGDSELRSVFVEQFLGPRRAAVGIIIDRAARRGEIPPCPDVEWICDLLTGPVVLRVVMPGLAALDESFISHTVASALSALDYQTPEGATLFVAGTHRPYAGP